LFGVRSICCGQVSRVGRRATILNNLEISWVFLEIADLLEIKGESPFKVRAYRQGARLLAELDEDIRDYAAAGRLTELPGIGSALAAKIEELVTTGSLAYLTRLRQEVPAGLRQMLTLPGVGPQTVRTIHKHLGISTLFELEKAAKAKKLRDLPGLGVKTELAIKSGIDLLRSRPRGMPLGLVYTVASELQEMLSLMPQVEKVSVAGGVRRREELVDGLLLVAAVPAPADREEVLSTFCAAPYVREVIGRSSNEAIVIIGIGVQATLVVVEPDVYSNALCYYTGNSAHWQELVSWAAQQGIALSSDKPLRLGTRTGVETEEELYCALGLAYVPPELRQGRGEVLATAKGELPELITTELIRGDLHLHTNWSDGSESISGMAQVAVNRGYEYIAVTDHSQSLSIARGLSPDRLREQMQEIQQVRSQFPSLKIFSGTEVDILADGQLDLPDDVLAERDLVIASVHSRFKQDRATMTRRILRALEHPAVDILAHPSGRLLGRRDPYAVDLEAVLATAQRYGKVLEINSSPERLDLSAEWARRAKELGIKLAINTDAHDARRLADIEFGVSVACRAGLSADDVINSWPGGRLEAFLAERRRKTGIG
jgi:DNA polymerase (family 10)